MRSLVASSALAQDVFCCNVRVDKGGLNHSHLPLSLQVLSFQSDEDNCEWMAMIGSLGQEGKDTTEKDIP